MPLTMTSESILLETYFPVSDVYSEYGDEKPIEGCFIIHIHEYIYIYAMPDVFIIKQWEI